jgi:hypothetical protein
LYARRENHPLQTIALACPIRSNNNTDDWVYGLSTDKVVNVGSHTFRPSQPLEAGAIDDELAETAAA